MTLVFEEHVDGPATHVIVIGVGTYTYMPEEGLSSPPYSARAFANWMLKKYRNPKKPLASLELLVSDAQTTEFTLPGGEVTCLEKASMTKAKEAIWQWKDRSDGRCDNLVIFYFCGHGIASGLETVLLMDDYGRNPNAMMENAIDFRGFLLGMDKCKAREQCYFVDACRKISETLIESDYQGDPVIHGSVRHSSLGMRRAPVYYSTVPGGEAYGRSNAPSVFTEALIKSLEGAGSDDPEGDWRIYTDRLNVGITYLIERMMGNVARLEQICPAENLTRITLHYIDAKPIVPVTIGCEPNLANKEAELFYSHCDGSNKTTRPNAQTSDWDVDLKEGEYRFSARFANQNYRSRDTDCRHVRPPYRMIRLEVRQ